MNYENCGFELAAEAKFCPECGTKVVKKLGFSLGEKNVIAGDVYGSKEDSCARKRNFHKQRKRYFKSKSVRNLRKAHSFALRLHVPKMRKICLRGMLQQKAQSLL